MYIIIYIYEYVYTHYIYISIAYRYMLTVHLIKMFQNKRTRNSYIIYLLKLKDNIFRKIITIEAKKLHSVFSISNDSFHHTFECTHVYPGTCT